MTDTLRSIEDHIIIWKSRNGKTDEDLAKEIGITRQALRMKRDGDTQFTLQEAMRLASLFGCSMDVLLNI